MKYQIDKLIEADRAIQVLDRTALHLEDVPPEYITKVFDAALDQLEKAQSEDKAASVRIESHDVLEFLSHMRESEDIPKREVARREYRALPILTSLDAHGLTLHEFMVEDPNFFVEVICDVYLPHEDDTTEERDPTPEEKARAQAGHTLLQGMNRVPGSQDDGTIDENVLERWIEAVRRGAKKEQRAEVADISIGHILAHAPMDAADDGWPHETIRNVLEKLDFESIGRGIMTERFNMRGTYMKDPYEGGEQEREFATQYRAWANLTRSSWPRTTRLLEAIAKRWDGEAKWSDTETEQRMQTE